MLNNKKTIPFSLTFIVHIYVYNVNNFKKAKKYYGRQYFINKYNYYILLKVKLVHIINTTCIKIDIFIHIHTLVILFNVIYYYYTSL